MNVAQILLKDLEACYVISWVRSICCTEKLMHFKKIEYIHSYPPTPPHFLLNTRNSTLVLSALCTKFHNLAHISLLWQREIINMHCQYESLKQIMYGSTNYEFKHTRGRKTIWRTHKLLGWDQDDIHLVCDVGKSYVDHSKLQESINLKI
jgi:hypothetical protein